MLAFNPAENIITYWDEPTITMDYPDHELHAVIHQNWVENKIPNVVLSCATLPREEEILDTIADFRSRFDDACIHTIASYDCRKSIPIVMKDGLCALPHTMYAEFGDMVECVRYCMENKTLLRYFDLSEIVVFIFYVTQKGFVPLAYQMKQYFADIASITMNSLKTYYLEVLHHIDSENWSTIYTDMKRIQKPKFQSGIHKSVSMDSGSARNNIVRSSNNSSGILLTTSDAHTLTDGPTIFLTEDAKKIGNFYIQQSEIPQCIFQDLLKKIDKNNKVSAQLEELEKKLDDITQPDSEKKTKQKEKDEELQSANVKDLYKKIEVLNKEIRTIVLEPEYVPNTKTHQVKWAKEVSEKAFCPSIAEQSIKDIMALTVDNSLKVLMLMGIGLFIEGVDQKYLELMKKLAAQQELYIIIAASDFIFGTNYNFCHGFIAKDMANMTQAKTIQCLGRIGRSAIQSTYTARFREDAFIYQLFKTPSVNQEAINMSRLFSS
jgi:hypothetical protein